MTALPPKAAHLQALNRLHEKYDFRKTQEILGQSTEEGLRLLEEYRNATELE